MWVHCRQPLDALTLGMATWNARKTLSSAALQEPLLQAPTAASEVTSSQINTPQSQLLAKTGHTRKALSRSNSSRPEHHVDSKW